MIYLAIYESILGSNGQRILEASEISLLALLSYHSENKTKKSQR